MALSWSMDKVGPICRSAHDCAIVFDVIRAEDENDPCQTEAGYVYKEVDLSDLKIGYFKKAFDEDEYFKKQNKESLKVLRKLGANLVPVDLDVDLPVDEMTILLLAEGAAAFDDLTLSNRDTLLVRQDENAWPAIFRSARYIPAVEYIQANRLRTLLIQEYDSIFREFDVIVTPSFGGTQLPATNMTGHPVVVVPDGGLEGGSRSSISFLGKLYDEATILAVAAAFQDATEFNKQRPPLFSSN